jgi:hypothetical protein
MSNQLRGGFDRGLGGGAESAAGQQYAALAATYMELARAWAQGNVGIEPDPTNFPGRLSSYNYSVEAEGHATTAEDRWNDFRSVYYGPLSSNPSVDPLGDPVDIGDMYYNTSAGELRVWDGTGWQALVVLATATLDSLTDVVISAPEAGQVLAYTGAGWTNVPAPSGGGSGGSFFYQNTAPTFPPAVEGSQWLNSDSGLFFVAVDDGSSLQWVEV